MKDPARSFMPSVLSLFAPDAYIKVTPGASLAKVPAAEIARSYVTRLSASSFISTAETPRQKACVVAREPTLNCGEIRDVVVYDFVQFLCCCPVALRPMMRTLSASGSSRHSRRTPCPTLPRLP